MTLLILGGTAEARGLTLYLHKRGERLINRAIYSVAGRVSVPALPCSVVSGGFSQFGGMQCFLQARKITGVADLTHPYAAQITQTAKAAARQLTLPYWRFQRPAWVPEKNDQWFEFERWSELLCALKPYRSVLFTVGQLPAAVLEQLSFLHHQTGQTHCIRTAVTARHNNSASTCWVTARGPFSVEAETALLKRQGVDVLVSKNSGGEMTAAKLKAARRLHIPVFMLKRPDETEPGVALAENVNFDRDLTFNDVSRCADAILEHYTFTERA